MRAFWLLAAALAFSGSLCAQRGGGFTGQPYITGGFGNVVFPGGTRATVPGVQRGFGSVAFPGGGGPQVVGRGQGLRPLPLARPYRSTGLVYAYPVYVGAYENPNLPDNTQPQQAPDNQPAYQQPAPSQDSGDSVTTNQSRFRMYDTPVRQAAPPAPVEETPYYLLAFKDHTVYSAVAYWVDGETIHYFTAGNKHNQASLSLVDRELTERLSKNSGFEVKLPAAEK